MKCCKCKRTLSHDQFVGQQGQRVRSCTQCRERAKKRWAEWDAARGGPAARRGVAVVPRVTMLDYPRKYCPNVTSVRNRPMYEDLQAEATRRGWLIGADSRVNWCAVHKHAAKHACDECLTEAAAWQYEWLMARKDELVGVTA